jgi:hypothetical protein
MEPAPVDTLSRKRKTSPTESLLNPEDIELQDPDSKRFTNVPSDWIPSQDVNYNLLLKNFPVPSVWLEDRTFWRGNYKNKQDIRLTDNMFDVDLLRSDGTEEEVPIWQYIRDCVGDNCLVVIITNPNSPARSVQLVI